MNKTVAIVAIVILLLIAGGIALYYGISVPSPSPASLIRVSAPKANDIIQSPVTVSGEARGNWFFEASFPIRVLDGDGSVLGTGIAQAQGEWTTINFVPFTAIVSFKTPKFVSGTLVLEKDNPSGLLKYANELRIPIVFAKTPVAGGKCFIGGCSNQICSEQEGVITTCEFKPEYACYKTAKCERQSNGACGWTPTPELQTCLKSPSSLRQSGSCTSTIECGKGFSCWYKIPMGPARGIPGSKENPGHCVDDEIIESIY